MIVASFLIPNVRLSKRHVRTRRDSTVRIWFRGRENWSMIRNSGCCCAVMLCSNGVFVCVIVLPLLLFIQFVCECVSVCLLACVCRCFSEFSDMEDVSLCRK